MERSNITDRSPGKGVYQGDLAYGRANGDMPVKDRDFSAHVQEDGKPKNKPCCQLVLTLPRDPTLWRKDPAIKEAKKQDTSGNQHATNVLLTTFVDCQRTLRANLSLTIGRQRF